MINPHSPSASIAVDDQLIVVWCFLGVHGHPQRRKLPLLSNMPAQIFHPPVLISGADAAREVAFGHPMPMFHIWVKKEAETAPGADGGIG